MKIPLKNSFCENKCANYKVMSVYFFGLPLPNFQEGSWKHYTVHIWIFHPENKESGRMIVNLIWQKSIQPESEAFI